MQSRPSSSKRIFFFFFVQLFAPFSGLKRESFSFGRDTNISLLLENENSITDVRWSSVLCLPSFRIELCVYIRKPRRKISENVGRKESGGSDFSMPRDNNRVYIQTEEKVIVGRNSFVGWIHSEVRVHSWNSPLLDGFEFSKNRLRGPSIKTSILKINLVE